MKVTATVDRLRREGIDVIDFGAGEPDFPALSIAKHAAHAAIDSDFSKYTPVPGIAELRRTLCERYKLDYETIKAINPGIIYCSVTGFGQTGPYAPRAGYDAILQAMGGLMSVTGHIDGEPGAGPMKVGPSIVDYMTGMNTSIGILSALYHRKANGGEGQHVDVCLFDTVIASLSHWLQIYLVNGQTPPRRGTWGNGGMPAGVFRCTDGEIMVVVGNDGQYARTCEVLGAPHIEERVGLTGGHIFQGEVRPDQMWENRFAPRIGVPGVYLCGGLCVDTRVYRSLDAPSRATISREGSLSRWLIERSIAALAPLRAVFAYTGDARSRRDAFAVGYVPAAGDHLLVQWHGEPATSRAALVARVEKLGRF